MRRYWLAFVLIAILVGCEQYKSKPIPPRTDEAASPTPSGPNSQPKANAGGPPEKIRIAKETTYVLGPVDKEGNIDYWGALRQRCSDGVTPENNAAILFWQAAGPWHIAEDRRDAFFEALGIPMPPAEGDYFPKPNVRDTLTTKTGPDKEAGAINKRIREEMQALATRAWSRLAVAGDRQIA